MNYVREGSLMILGAALALLSAPAAAAIGSGDSLLEPAMLLVGGSLMLVAAALLLRSTLGD